MDVDQLQEIENAAAEEGGQGGNNSNQNSEEAVQDNEANDDDTDEQAAAKKGKISIQRFKGLGEMNADELWETTMDPEQRILKQVNIEDAQDADKVFDMLMGTDVPARKMFIQSNAKKATIDI